MPAEAQWASVCSFERYPAACFLMWLRGRDVKPYFPYLSKLALPSQSSDLEQLTDQAIDAVGAACVNSSLATEAHVRGCLFGLSFSTYTQVDSEIWNGWRAENHQERDDRPSSLVAFCSSARFVEPRWILSRPDVHDNATSSADWRERERQRWMSCIAGSAFSIGFMRVGGELPGWVIDTFCSQLTNSEPNWLMPSQRAEGAALCLHTCKLNISEPDTALHPLSWLGFAAKVIAGVPRQ